jgi:hypothetical protein
MKAKIIFIVISLISISTFTFHLYKRLTQTVLTLKEQLKINMTGTIGVLESIYVHNAFQCIIGVVPVAIFTEKSSASSELPLLPASNTFYGASCHGTDHRNSPVISVASLISEFDNTSS